MPIGLDLFRTLTLRVFGPMSSALVALLRPAGFAPRPAAVPTSKSMCMRAGPMVPGSSRSGAATRGCCARLAREQRDHTTRRRRAATGLTRSSGADGWLGRAHRLALRAHSVRPAPEQSQGNARKREMRVGSEQSRDEGPAEAVLQ